MLRVIPVAVVEADVTGDTCSIRQIYVEMLTIEQLYDLQKSRGIQTVECVKYTYVIRRRNGDMLIKKQL